MGRHRIRNKLIKPFIQGKKVLDLGSLNHNLGVTELYDFLKQHSSVVGSDIIKKEGFVYLDAENIILDEKFDVVVAGELIEHLYNPNNFLQSVKNIMRDDSYLIITTPNAVSPYYFLFNSEPGIGHTHWHSMGTLKRVLEFNGFEIVKSAYYSRESFNPLNLFFHFFCLFFPKLNLHLLVVAKIKKV